MAVSPASPLPAAPSSRGRASGAAAPWRLGPCKRRSAAAHLALIACLGCAGRGAGVAAAEAREKVRVRGLEGKIAFLNGVYAPTDEVFNRYPCYQKEDDPKHWLCTDTNGYWNAQPAAQRGTGDGFMISDHRWVPTPQEAGPWRAWRDGRWHMLDGVAVEVATLSGSQDAAREGERGSGKEAGSRELEYRSSQVPKPVDPAEPEAEGSELQHPNLGGVLVPVHPEESMLVDPHHHAESAENGVVTLTVSVVLLFVMAMGMVVMSLTHSTDPHIRSYMYKMISTMLTILTACLVTQALLLFLLVWVYPKLGFGTANEEVWMGTSFVFTVVFEVSVNILGWKFQYSRSRLLTTKYLGEQMVGFSAIFMFDTMLQSGVQIGMLMFDSEAEGHSSIKAALPICITILLLALAFLSLMRAATRWLRRSFLKNPPNIPWAPAWSQRSLVDDARSDRTCGFFGGGGDSPAQGAKDLSPLDWSDEITQSEDETTIEVLSFLINQVMIFCLTGELCGLEIEHAEHTMEDINWWFGINALCIVLLTLVHMIRRHFGDRSRAGRIVQWTIGMSVSWGFYRQMSWYIELQLNHDVHLAHLVAACIVSIESVLIVYLMDRLADYLGVGSKWELDGKLYRDLHAGTSSHVVNTIRMLITSFSLMVAISWDQAFEAAFATIVARTPFLRGDEGNNILWVSILSISLAALIVRPWRRLIMPRAEISVRAHEAAIEHELDHMMRAERCLETTDPLACPSY